MKEKFTVYITLKDGENFYIECLGTKNYILENILEAINSKKWIVATKYLAGGKWYLRTSEIIRFAIKKDEQ